MAIPIIPRLVRGRLYFQIADVLFPTLAEAMGAWSAHASHGLDIAEPIDKLIVQRTEALAEMRRAGPDMALFSAASKRESQLAIQIRELRRKGGGL